MSKKPASTSDTPVTWEDQDRINRFGRLNVRLAELNETLKQTQKELDDLQDAEETILLADDESEPVRYKVGDVFFELPQETAQEKLKNSLEKSSSSRDAAAKEAADIKKEMSTIKSVLYAKFGDSINLDDDDEE